MNAIEQNLLLQHGDSIHEKLCLANKKVEFQFVEIEKMAEELITANKELALQNIKNDKRTAELIIANKELIFQNEEREKRATELLTSNEELKKTEINFIEYVKRMEQMMYATSHKIRPPVANILGLTKLLENLKKYPEDLPLYLDYINQSAVALDDFNKELTTSIFNLVQKRQANICQILK